MGIDKTRRDIGRRELEFGNNQIDKALPEYFQEEFPKLIQFLDAYYEHLDSDGNFGFKIKDLPSSRDISQTAKENLTLLEDELLLGGNYLEGILDQRTGAELANNYYRTKGTKYSFERFFRSFFKEDPQVIYGKDLIFNLNDGANNSIIGPDTDRKIQNDKVYQHWGLLFKIGIQQSTWEELYELFAHPAGMYYASEIQITAVNANISFDNMPIPIPDVPKPIIYLDIGSMAPAALTEPSAIVTTDEVTRRLSLDRMTIQAHTLLTQDSTGFGSLQFNAEQYPSMVDMIRMTSPTMDMDSDGTSLKSSISLDNTNETLDREKFKDSSL
jgi:hypothetical protein